MQAAKQWRVRSIESRLRRIVLVPMAALVAVWLVVSGYLFYGAATQYALVKGNEEMLTPAAIALAAVMDERSATIAYLERPDETEDALEGARAESDRYMEDILDKFEGVLPFSPEPVQERIRTLDSDFSQIDIIRRQVDRGNASRSDVLEYYNGLSEAGADLFDEQSRFNPSKEVVGHGLSATYMFRVVDDLARADALLSRAFASGELSEEDQEEFTRLVGSYRAMLGSLDEFMGPEVQRDLDELRDGSDWATLTELEEEITGRTTATATDPVTGEETQDLAMPVDEDEWREVYTPVKDTLTELGASQALWATDVQAKQANRAIALAAVGIAGIATLGFLTFTFTTRSSQNLVGRLHRLRDETQHLTDHELPDVLERVRGNEGVPVCTEALQISGGSDDDEVGQVARSFNSAHRTAVDAAIRQAELRQGVNRVFLNIAHRSQTLIHRQLRLLDRMEREQEDPSKLTDLFKLDHLATRSRRNAENLLILGGETPGRTWSRPMPLIDVLRGAISESGDYTRVKRERIARVSLKSPAVADVIHLVAELVDNATTFSPPHTQVRLSSEQVPNGVTIEIEDRGLGMREEEFTATNKLLVDPPEFDVMRLNERMRLGLFVVSRLANRHDIKVWLRSSPYGGVLAIVLLPPEIIADDTPELPESTGAGEAPDADEPDQPSPALTDDGSGSAAEEAVTEPSGDDAPDGASTVPSAESGPASEDSEGALPRREPGGSASGKDGPQALSPSAAGPEANRRTRRPERTPTTVTGRPRHRTRLPTRVRSSPSGRRRRTWRRNSTTTLRRPLPSLRRAARTTRNAPPNSAGTCRLSSRGRAADALRDDSARTRPRRIRDRDDEQRRKGLGLATGRAGRTGRGRAVRHRSLLRRPPPRPLAGAGQGASRTPFRGRLGLPEPGSGHRPPIRRREGTADRCGDGARLPVRHRRGQRRLPRRDRRGELRRRAHRL